MYLTTVRFINSAPLGATVRLVLLKCDHIWVHKWVHKWGIMARVSNLRRLIQRIDRYTCDSKALFGALVRYLGHYDVGWSVTQLRCLNELFLLYLRKRALLMVVCNSKVPQVGNLNKEAKAMSDLGIYFASVGA